MHKVLRPAFENISMVNYPLSLYFLRVSTFVCMNHLVLFNLFLRAPKCHQRL